ncbi:LOW QUALITY PROTEIN: nuclear receptor subfamily 1 group I member 3 [Rhynchonycteris naso]
MKNMAKKQKELVQTLLGAHAHHTGTMFEFVQFRQSTYRTRAESHLLTHHQHSLTLVPVMLLLTHSADIKFTKNLPLFWYDKTLRCPSSLLSLVTHYFLLQRFLWAKLLGLLAKLQSINNVYGHHIQRIQELSATMPLLQEMSLSPSPAHLDTLD